MKVKEREERNGREGRRGVGERRGMGEVGKAGTGLSESEMEGEEGGRG